MTDGTQHARAFSVRSRIATRLLGALAIVSAAATPALAQQFQSPLQATRQYDLRAEWADRFDATLPELKAVNSSLPTLSAEAPARLQAAIQTYSRIAATGGWPTVPQSLRNARLGRTDRDVRILRRRLIVTGDLQERGGRTDTFDSYVDAALRRFQLRNGLSATGVLDDRTLYELNMPVGVRLQQLQANLPRIQGLAGTLGDRYVMVNIPAAQVEAVDHGLVQSRHTAIVGKIDRPSPQLSSKIYQVTFNPYWTVPVSIIHKDLIPVMKKDPQYLTKNHIHIYKAGTKDELTADQIDWNSDEATQYTFRQDPGALNSMGTVKIHFHNQYDVYLHDTPAKSLFGDDFRFDSSGCVRVQNIRELIAWLLQPMGWTQEQVDQAIRSGDNLNVDLPAKNQIPVYFTYVTAWANADGVVHFRDDIYQLDGTGTLALR